MGLAAAQSGLPDADLVVLTPEVTLGEAASVEVHIPPGMDFDLTVEWGDGATDNVDRFGAAVQTFDHVYATTGAKTVRLTLFDFTVPETHEIDTDVIVVTPGATLDVSPTTVVVGETVAATVTSGPEGGRLDWGDGALDVLAGDPVEEFEHAYAATGVYTVRLLDFGGDPIATAVVSVTPGALTFDLDPTGEVGQPVGLLIEGLAGNAPDGARLEWGDGSVEVVQEDGEYTHTYAVAGTITVRLRRLPGDELLAQASTTVGAYGFLDLPGVVTLFEPTPISASGLAPGLTYRIDYGDGLFDLLTADTAGTVASEHVYELPKDRFAVTLRLAEPGQDVQLDSRTVIAELPLPTEELAVTATPVPDEARFDVTVTSTGLLPGLSYLGYSPQLGTVLLSPDGPGTATGTIEAFQEGEFTFELQAHVNATGGGFREELRATASVSVAWPRGNEALDIEHVYDQVLAGEVVTVVASGLEPAYGYDLVVNGEVDAPYRLDSGEVGELPEPGVWRVELPVELFGPDVTLDLYARYPNQFQVLGTPELRASESFTAVTPTGALALDDPVVPYLVPTPVHATELMPGLPYRLELPDDRVERFEGPDDGELTFEHAFPGGLPASLYVDIAGLDSQPVATVTPSGITFTGKLGYSYDLQGYLQTGEVTMHVRGATPNHVHVVTFNDGRRYEAETDANGEADIVVEEPLVEAYLYVQAFGSESFVGQTRLQLPPSVVNFYLTDGWQVRITRLEPVPGSGFQEDGTFVPPFSPEDVTGEGELVNFVVGGRLQDPIPVRFEHLRLLGSTVMEGNANLVADSLQADLPLALEGASLTFTDIVLKPYGEMPSLSGVIALPTGESQQFAQVLMPTGSPTEGFMVTITDRGPGAQVGTSPWRFRVGERGAMVDLSTASDYNLMREDGGTALAHAYRGYEEVGRPNPAGAGGSWVGVLYHDAEFTLSDSGTVGSGATFTGDLAWTSAGATAYLTGELGDENGRLELGGWTFTDVTGLELLVVDDQVVRFTRPHGMVYLPFFGEDVPVGFQPAYRPTGPQWLPITIAPVAHSYGSTAVVGGLGVFVNEPNLRLGLRFPSAVWALDGDLAADPNTIDASTGEALIDGLPGLTDAERDLARTYDDAVSTAETLLNVFQLQLLLKDLTLHPDGSVDLGGSQWRTLAKAPTLNMYGFPYLGAGAEIGVKREGGQYAIGLRGELRLADVLEAKAAPSWFYHQGGQETRWAFEGVGVKFGGFEESPVTFSLVVGGVIDTQRLALSFTGGGSLTLPDLVSVEALGLFGIVDTGGPLPDPFWFVSAGVDLANMARPINVNVQGVDVLAFYAFRGGIASHLRIDVGGGDCRVDDGDVAAAVLPSISTHALECYDPDLPISFLAGTLIGSPVQGGAAPPLYGKIWHLDANLVVNLGKGGDLQLAGRGWIGKSLDEGYRQRTSVPEQIAGRLVVNSSGITGSLCAGPQSYAVEGIDCSGLSPAEIREAGILLAQFDGTIEFKASWADAEYYFALGRKTAPLYGYVIPSYVQGYLVTGYIRKPGILDPNVALPAGGFWVGAQTGFRWDYSDSGSALVCDWSVWASAGFGYGGALGIQMVPAFQFSAEITAYGWAEAGGSICGESESLGASIRAVGRIQAPNPTEFRGDFEVKIKLPVVPDIDVTIENVGVTLN
jgi:hypothetical protein